MQEVLRAGVFSALFENSEHAFIAMDSDRRIRAFSKGLSALTGHDPAKLAGQPFSSLFPDKKSYKALIEAAGKSPLLRNFKSLVLHENGAQERVTITLRAIAGGQGYLAEISPAMEDLGSSPGVASQTIQEMLVKMERFSAVGRMAAVFAHEMRTPIHIISSTAELILGDLPKGAPHRENLDMILRNANHAGLSIRALLDFAKAGKPQLRKGSINEVFQAAMELIGKLFEKRGSEVHEEYEKVPEIMMDFHSMRAIVHSLLINSADAMPSGGNLFIRTDISEKSGGIRFSVRDTGTGMPKEVLERVGSAFFTTKAEGTGLGLYLTKRVLAEHGAEITFASAENQGTTITIEFPSPSPNLP